MAVTRSRRGSACEAVVTLEQELFNARSAVNGLGHIFPGMERECWLDVKKSREQLAPSRMLTAFHGHVREWEVTRDENKVVEKKSSQTLHHRWRSQILHDLG